MMVPGVERLLDAALQNLFGQYLVWGDIGGDNCCGRRRFGAGLVVGRFRVLTASSLSGPNRATHGARNRQERQQRCLCLVSKAE